MKRSKFTEAQIVSILKLAEQGAKVADICREHGISSASYYQWKNKYGGLEASDLKRLRDLVAVGTGPILCSAASSEINP